MVKSPFKALSITRKGLLMSYCRFFDSDAYIYDSVDLGLICVSCSVTGDNSTFIAGSNYDKMLKHVKDHRNLGHFIPEYVDDDLTADKNQQG